MTSSVASMDGEPVDWPADAIEVGRVLGPWGVKGWVKVQPYAQEPEALFSSKRWYAQPPAPGQPAAGPRRGLWRVIQAREQGDTVVAMLDGVDDRDAAQALRGWAVFVSRSSFPTPEPDAYYWVDLIGMRVVNRSDEPLGCVVGLLSTGAHDVLRVAAPDDAASPSPAAERLIPFVGAYVDSVDRAAGLIRVDWGLDY
jgi:16S rRNA processing protein RimM